MSKKTINDIFDQIDVIMEEDEVDHVDVIIGGPPCQAYSLAGRSRMMGGDKEKYENNLVELVELGLKADDGEMIEVACSMLATFYRNERRYKAAYEVVNTLLQYNKNGIEESIYNEDRNIAFYK
mgnify:CR=1 FL=1